MNPKKWNGMNSKKLIFNKLKMTIENKNLGINSDDVYSCEDKLKLLEWRVGVSETYFDIWKQLIEATAEKERTGVYKDRDWFNNTKTACRLQEILLFQIEHRLEQLKQQ